MGSSSLIADSRKRRKIFDRRAESILKQARELSVLCDVPACVVIYNPDDAIKPWRIWPESEAELRNVIEFYKGKVGSGSTSSLTTVVGNGVVTKQADDHHEWKQIDHDLDGKIESRIMEYANNVKNQSNIIDQEPPHPISTAVDQQADNINNENNSKLDAAADATFDGWDDDDENNDLLHTHELLNFSDCDDDDDDFDPTLLFQKETESADATCSSAPAVGIKWKAAPVRVSSFEELMIPSTSHRRKLI